MNAQACHAGKASAANECSSKAHPPPVVPLLLPLLLSSGLELLVRHGCREGSLPAASLFVCQHCRQPKGPTPAPEGPLCLSFQVHAHAVHANALRTKGIPSSHLALRTKGIPSSHLALRTKGICAHPILSPCFPPRLPIQRELRQGCCGGCCWGAGLPVGASSCCCCCCCKWWWW